MRGKIIEILEEIRPGVDYDTETDLIGRKILESLAIIQLITALSDEYDIEIPLPFIRPENFESVDAITAMVSSIIEEEQE